MSSFLRAVIAASHDGFRVKVWSEFIGHTILQVSRPVDPTDPDSEIIRKQVALPDNTPEDTYWADYVRMLVGDSAFDICA